MIQLPPELLHWAGNGRAADYESGGLEVESLRARQYNQQLTSISQPAQTCSFPLGAQLGAHDERLARATTHPLAASRAFTQHAGQTPAVRRPPA
jgi:hypothetical protein